MYTYIYTSYVNRRVYKYVNVNIYLYTCIHMMIIAFIINPGDVWYGTLSSCLT